jgi:hypothetical protein
METNNVKKHLGSCHCGDVRFEVEIDATRGGRCNCSICHRLAGTTGMVKPAAFKLLTDEAKLTMYEWGGKTGQRYFCARCGVTCFGKGYLEQVGGAYVSVFLNCLEEVDVNAINVGYWDGRHNNWQAGMRSAPWPIAPSA